MDKIKFHLYRSAGYNDILYINGYEGSIMMTFRDLDEYVESETRFNQLDAQLIIKLNPLWQWIAERETDVSADDVCKQLLKMGCVESD